MSRLEQLEKMLKADPNDAFLNFGLAMEYARAGRAEDAIAQFVRVTELDPKYVPAYFQRGNYLVSIGRREEAKAALQEGIEVARQIGDTHAAGEMSEALAMIG